MYIYHEIRQNFSVLLIVLLAIFISSFSIPTTVKAAEDPDYANAIRTAPKGLLWDDNDFLKADFTGNEASINTITNPYNTKTSVIKVTNNFYQVGGIWSNAAQDNYFDVSHDQTASMWLYFGHGTPDKPQNNGDTDSKVPGDGMAFVLQNDSRGTNAIATGIKPTDPDKQIVPADGQSLGVW